MEDRRLDRYRAKRDDSVTPEPQGSPRASAHTDGRFSIQHHCASSEHYDLRLGHQGVLLSWAVPKGPSTDPSEKRLAIRTEDHPGDYIDFEGNIPEGEYGAGSVIVWDAGTWDNATTDGEGHTRPVDEALDAGHLHIELAGEKLCGGYVLQRTRGRGERSQWLLIKVDDDGADARRNPTSTQPRSVTSGRTVDEVGGEGRDGD